jgi:hypothetical protein
MPTAVLEAAGGADLIRDGASPDDLAALLGPAPGGGGRWPRPGSACGTSATRWRRSPTTCRPAPRPTRARWWRPPAATPTPSRPRSAGWSGR